MSPSPEEIKAVVDSLSIIDNSIILCKRISEPTLFQIQYSIELTKEMALEHNIRMYILDARGTIAPNAQLRQGLRTHVATFADVLDYLLIAVGDDPTLKISSAFIFHTMPQNFIVQLIDSPEEGVKLLKKLQQSKTGF